MIEMKIYASAYAVKGLFTPSACESLSKSTHWTAQMLRLLAAIFAVFIAYYATIEAATVIVRAFL